jgi:hypothetical protein
VISFQDTWPETGGKWLTAITLLGLIAAGVRRRLGRRYAAV